MKLNLREEVHDLYSLDERDLNDSFWNNEGS
jgi:hypothetical protein